MTTDEILECLTCIPNATDTHIDGAYANECIQLCANKNDDDDFMNLVTVFATKIPSIIEQIMPLENWGAHFSDSPIVKLKNGKVAMFGRGVIHIEYGYRSLYLRFYGFQLADVPYPTGNSTLINSIASAIQEIWSDTKVISDSSREPVAS
ncbi:MAG: hypothetical protein LBH87_00385 [Coriobacteriales bacterium]|jgi:hypothetical protein|nr:hypothetical protein [Coriobacteriales bacterium]